MIIRRWPILVGIVAALAVAGIVWFFVARNDPDSKVAPLPERTKEQEEADRIRVEVQGRDMDVETLNRSDSGWALFVTGESEGIELDLVLKQISELFIGLDRLDLSFTDVGILLRTSDLKDAYGNTLEELPIVEIGLSKETLEKIDWDGFAPQNFERVADRYWVHEEIQRMADEKKAQEESQGQGGSGSGGGSGGGGSAASGSGG